MKQTGNKMGKSATLVLILMVVIGIACGIGFYNYTQTLKSVIYIFSNSYKAGTSVAENMFLAQEIDTATYNALGAGTSGVHYVTRDEIRAYVANGEFLACDVVQYAPATDNLFVTTGGTGVESRLANDKVGVEILENKVYGLSGNEVRVGSRVNITTHYTEQNEQDIEEKKTELLFQDLLVIDVIADEDGKITSIYVECAPEEVLPLQHALVYETVSVSVLKPGAYKVMENPENTAYSKVYEVPLNADGSAASDGRTKVDINGNVIR